MPTPYRLLIMLLAATTLFACGDEDNSEPPAELVPFEQSVVLEELWSASPDSGIGQHFVYLEPLFIDGSLVSAGRDGHISVIDLESGDISRELETGTDIGAGVGGDAQTWLVADQNGETIAIDAADGSVKWRTNVNSEVLTRPVEFDGAVYVRTVDGQLISIDAASGNINWTYSKVLPALTLRGNAAPILTRDWVLLTQDDGHITALDHATGKTVWDIEVSTAKGRSEIERLVDIDGRAELYGQVLYVGGFQGGLAAIDIRQGKIAWSRDFSTWSGVTVDDKVLYVTDERGHIWAIDRFSGATMWKQDALTARAVTRPVIYRDYLAVGDYAGVLHLLSRQDGGFVAREELSDEDAGIFLPPLVHDDRLIVILRDGRITAFDSRVIQAGS